MKPPLAPAVRDRGPPGSLVQPGLVTFSFSLASNLARKAPSSPQPQSSRVVLALTRRGLQILPFSGFGLRKAEKRVDGAACLTGGSIMVSAKCDIVPANSKPIPSHPIVRQSDSRVRTCD